MELFNTILTAVLLVALIGLVIVFIVVGIKMLNTLDKVNVILTDVEHKLDSVNGLFEAIDSFKDFVSNTVEGVIGKVLTFFKKEK